MLTMGFRVQPGCKIYGVKGSTILSVNSDGNIICIEWGLEEGSLEVVAVERKRIVKFQQAYQEYEEAIKEINDTMEYRLEIFKDEFMEQERKQKEEFGRELLDR
jgi:hypothetical protein